MRRVARTSFARRGVAALGSASLAALLCTVPVAPALASEREHGPPAASERASAAVDAPGLTPEQAEAARAWRGRACTPTGCGPAPVASAASVAGFGVAAVGAAWLGRRRRR